MVNAYLVMMDTFLILQTKSAKLQKNQEYLIVKL